MDCAFKATLNHIVFGIFVPPSDQKIPRAGSKWETTEAQARVQKTAFISTNIPRENVPR